MQEILNILSLKEGAWNSSKITLNISTGSYREGGPGETAKITLAGPGEHTASPDTAESKNNNRPCHREHTQLAKMVRTQDL